MPRRNRRGKNKWSIDPKRLGRELKVRPIIAVRATLFELSSRIVLDSPVGHPDFKAPGDNTSGNFRLSWKYGINLKRADYDPDIGATLQFGSMDEETASGILLSLSRLKIGNSWAFLNASPQAAILELGLYPNPPLRGSYNYTTKEFEILSAGGFSRQAPKGMVIHNVEAFATIARDAIRRTRRRPYRV